jgi:hypothetical protein
MIAGWENIVAIIDAAAPIAAPNVIALVPKASSAAKASAREKKAGVSADKPADAASSSPASDAENPADGHSRAPASETGDAGDDEAKPAQPKARGFSIEQMNKEFALVLMGSKAVVFLEQPDAPIEDQKRVLSLDALRAWFANRFTERLSADDKIKTVTWATAWLQSKKRRSYKGIEFHPNPDGAPGTDGYLNLWSGFSIEAAKEPDVKRYKTFRDHLLTNVCSGDDALFKWVFGFLAHMLQRPRERMGVALVLRGRMGSGKTKIGEVIGWIIPRHYFLVDDPRYVTGQFNAHMATCLLLQADEAVWAGDKAAEGRLKGLVTSPIQQIEAKGVDPIRLKNYVRLILTSNEDWVVPAGKDERRFAVLDVDPRCAQNHDYFGEMDKELLADGGLAHLLGDLLRFDLNSIDLRKIPRTDALLEQKIRTLDSVESWWYGRLRSGATLRYGVNWNREVACSALFDDYIATSEKIGVRRKQEETVFGIKLGKLLPQIDRKKRTIDVQDEQGNTSTKRTWCYIMPDIVEARDTFARSLNQTVTWPLDDDAKQAPVADSMDEQVPF